ncbi:MAG: ZIP family metal transporter, partial [Clostridia bacterium]|nr:ZIP family metal transporter [Clostridia bacterium]
MTEKTIILLMSLVAGVAGTGLGGLIGVLFKKKNDDVLSAVLAVAGGIMLGVVAFDLLPEAVDFMPKNKAASTAIIVLFFVLGIAVVKGINTLFDKAFMPKISNDKNCVKSQYNSFSTTNSIVKMLVMQNGENQSILRKTGFTVLFAIALHNFPEGVAIGSSGVYEMSSGALIALVIALHNIPEGMAISAPLVAGGMNKMKSVLLTIFAGATTIIGAVVGVYVGDISSIALSVCLSIASGAMAYVACFELLP